MPQISPAFFLMLICFMIFPLVVGGKLSEKMAKSVGALIASIFMSPFLILAVAIVAGLINLML